MSILNKIADWFWFGKSDPAKPKDEMSRHDRFGYDGHAGWPMTEVIDAILEHLEAEFYVGTDERDGSPMLKCRKKDDHA